MSPTQFENQVLTFYHGVKQKCEELIRKDELAEHDTPEWLAWDDDTSNDIPGFLGAISRTVNNYDHIVN